MFWPKKHKKHSLFFAVLFISLIAPSFFFSGAVSCSSKEGYYDTTDALTRYPEVKVVDFSVSGSAVCSWCASSEENITALMLEIVPEDDVTKTLAMKFYEGPGPFSFPGLRYASGMRLTVSGRLYRGIDKIAAETQVKVTVPDNDGETISCVLNFPGS